MEEKEYRIFVLASPTVPINFIGQHSSYGFKIKGLSSVKQIFLHNVEADNLHFIAHVTSNSINDAIDEAIPQVRGIVSNLVYLVSSRIPIITPVAAWESEPENKGEFVQFVSPVQIKNPEKQPIDVKDISKTMATLNDREDEITYQFTRAVRWYRNALLTESAIERLIFLWIAFEAIDPLLCKYLRIEPEALACQQCNHEYGIKTNQGIKKWIEKLQQEKEIPLKPSFNDIRSARGKIVHSGSKLVKNESEWVSASEILGKALLLALDEIIGFRNSRKRNHDLIIERVVRVRIDGQISQKSQNPPSGIPPIFNFQRGTGCITLQSREPHLWELPEPLKQLPNSDFETHVDKITTTYYNSIQSHAQLELR